MLNFSDRVMTDFGVSFPSIQVAVNCDTRVLQPRQALETNGSQPCADFLDV